MISEETKKKILAASIMKASEDLTKPISAYRFFFYGLISFALLDVFIFALSLVGEK